MFCDFGAGSSLGFGYCNDRPSSSSSSTSASLPPPPVCRQVDQSCDDVNTCCNSQCENGTCQCSLLGSQCQTERDCCPLYTDQEKPLGHPECLGGICMDRFCPVFTSLCGTSCCTNKYNDKCVWLHSKK
jgi:hypothetical protein